MSSSIAESVVAVPISTIIIGALYWFIPATASTTRSLPSCAGLSILMERPVFIPGPTTLHFTFVYFSTAALTVLVILGTTDEMIAPSMSEPSSPFISTAVLSVTAYSRSVAVRFVDTLSLKSILSSSQQPKTMLVFPISTASIIFYLLRLCQAVFALPFIKPAFVRPTATAAVTIVATIISTSALTPTNVMMNQITFFPPIFSCI